MKSHIIMDRRGDTRHEFDATPVALAEAEERFRNLTRRGFRAVALGKDGNNVLMRDFDPEVEQTLFIPQLVGG